MHLVSAKQDFQAYSDVILKQWSREDFSIRALLLPTYMRKPLNNKRAASKPVGLQMF